MQYDFKKNFVKLLIKTLKPESNSDDPMEVKKFFSAQEWLKEENVMKLMVHAETICQALAYIETLRVLAAHANKDSARLTLFKKYHRLVAPRFVAIYEDWSLS